MSNLLVRDLEPEVIQSLKERAASHGRSAESEHREILREALARPQKKSFTQILSEMPDVGLDSDFERIDDNTESNDSNGSREQG